MDSSPPLYNVLSLIELQLRTKIHQKTNDISRTNRRINGKGKKHCKFEVKSKRSVALRVPIN